MEWNNIIIGYNIQETKKNFFLVDVFDVSKYRNRTLSYRFEVNSINLIQDSLGMIYIKFSTFSLIITSSNRSSLIRGLGLKFNLKYQPAKKIIFVFLMLTLISSVPTITFVTDNNVNLAFASDSSSDDSGDSSSDDSGDSSSDDSGDSSSDDSGDSSSDDSGGSTTTTPATDSRVNSPSATIGNTPTSSQACPDGSVPVSNGMCPSPTASSSLSPAFDCIANPDDPSCTTTTTSTTEQNFAPNTLTQPRCPLLPTDANGNCQGVDMQGGGAGSPSQPLIGYNPENHSQVSKGLPSQQQATYSLPVNSTQVSKLPDGSCPPGALLTTEDLCREIPVLPGSTTGSGGGFIQMFPEPQSK
jgi:hypothetical protein